MKRLIRNKYVRRGSAVVETAVVAPLMVAAMLGTIEVGHAFMVKQTVTLAAREGARAGSLPGGTLADIEAAVDASMAAIDLEPAVLVDPNNPELGYEACGYWTESNIELLGPSDPELWVEVSVPLECVSITGYFGSSTVNIASKTTMRREGVDPD
jgi:hypothetical protein